MNPTNSKEQISKILFEIREGKDIEWITNALYALQQEAVVGVLEEVKAKVGSFRQWLNEKPADHLVTNQDIEIWLDLESKLSSLKEKPKENKDCNCECHARCRWCKHCLPLKEGKK